MKKFTVFVLVLMAIVTMASVQAEASTVYNVKSGDTLAEISDEIGVPLNIIIDQNDIVNPSNIYVGQKLVITINVEYQDSKQNYGYYTVQQGDILWNIAQKYDTTVEKLVQLNDIKNSYDLYVGRRLVVPVKNNQEPEENNYYIVQEGDILWNIAQKYNTTVEKLIQLNNIKNSYDLYVGRKLILPTDKQDEVEKPERYSYPLYYTYQVQEGDNIRAIAYKFGVDVLDIVQANDMYNNINDIETGTDLIIPLDESNRFNYIKKYSKLLDNYYRVNSNETVADIAEKFSISENVLRTINNLEKEEQVYNGQKLLMPVNSGFFKKHKIYRVTKEEEYIADIAYKNGVTIRSIVQANYLKDLNVKLKKGTTILVTLDEDSKTRWITKEYN